MRTRVKICGITRPADAIAAAQAGADAIGLVFYPPSPRYLSVERAVEIRDALPPFVQTVALFVNPDAAQVAQVIGRVRPSMLSELNADLVIFGMGERSGVRVAEDLKRASELIGGPVNVSHSATQAALARLRSERGIAYVCSKEEARELHPTVRALLPARRLRQARGGAG